MPGGPDKPYAVAPGNIFVRQESETSLALRDEIVDLVKLGLSSHGQPADAEIEARGEFSVGANGDSTKQSHRGRRTQRQPDERASQTSTPDGVADLTPAGATDDLQRLQYALPRTGVEIVDSVERDGVIYHSMRDLRNMKVVHNVTRDSARKLWRYAIIQKEQHAPTETDISWKNGRGFWKSYKPRGADRRFNLAFRENGEIRVFYGVTEDGIDAEWREVVPGKYLAG